MNGNRNLTMGEFKQAANSPVSGMFADQNESTPNVPLAHKADTSTTMARNFAMQSPHTSNPMGSTVDFGQLNPMQRQGN